MNFFSRTKLPDTAKWLFVGLGNPGEKYSSTRHNIGFRIVDVFGKLLDSPKKFHLCEADCLISSDGSVIVAKPVTFMNRSGDAVQGLMNRFKISSNSVVVVVDDFNIGCGTIRLRRDGSHGGHNGLKSISALIGDKYPRVRIGIGPLPQNVSVIDFVLGTFTDTEEKLLEGVIPRAVSTMNALLTDSIDTVMSKYNK
ncbi:MAG TPA: aminoacyl-tRNA hydrolase [Chitinispirillaceae bacterium]|nr:aminoacyl-tRNA hydrolase [Chitinispirillaceae bacterium]